MAKMKRERKYNHRHRPIAGGAPPSGYIFICDRVTKPECFQFQVFGLPMSRIDTVVRIEPGAPLFLFDCELRILYGVYGAASHGGANLVPHAFGGKFPAQVMMVFFPPYTSIYLVKREYLTDLHPQFCKWWLPI